MLSTLTQRRMSVGTAAELAAFAELLIDLRTTVDAETADWGVTVHRPDLDGAARSQANQRIWNVIGNAQAIIRTAERALDLTGNDPQWNAEYNAVVRGLSAAQRAVNNALDSRRSWMQTERVRRSFDMPRRR